MRRSLIDYLTADGSATRYQAWRAVIILAAEIVALIILGKTIWDEWGR